MVLNIAVNIVLPIFILVGVGVAVDHFFKLDLPTLSKLNFYVFVPALILIKTLDAQLSPALFATVALFTGLQITLMFLLSWALFGLRPFAGQRPVLTLAAILSNAGNYGIPLATLAFGAEGAGAMASVVLVQNFMTFTAGLWIMDSGHTRLSDMLKGFLKVPVVWAAFAALALISLHVTLPKPIHDPLAYLSDGLIPVALITLGIQLARSRPGAQWKAVTLVTAIRLLVSPILAIVLAAIWALAAPTSINQVAPVMVIAAGMPVAVNVYILSVEYRRDSELASQTIFATTLLSVVTLTAWLLFVKAG